MEFKQRILDEIHSDSRIIAGRLFGDLNGDARAVRRGEYLTYLRTMWDAEPFRARLRKQLGDQHFIEVASEVHGLPRPRFYKDDVGRMKIDWKDHFEGLPPASADDMLEVAEAED